MNKLILTLSIFVFFFISCQSSSDNNLDNIATSLDTSLSETIDTTSPKTVNKTTKQILEEKSAPSVFELYDLEIKKDNNFNEFGIVSAKNNSKTKTIVAIRFYVGNDECNFMIEKKKVIKPLVEHQLRFAIPKNCKHNLKRITINEIVYSDGDYLDGMQIFMEKTD